MGGSLIGPKLYRNYYLQTCQRIHLSGSKTRPKWVATLSPVPEQLPYSSWNPEFLKDSILPAFFSVGNSAQIGVEEVLEFMDEVFQSGNQYPGETVVHRKHKKSG